MLNVHQIGQNDNLKIQSSNKRNRQFTQLAVLLLSCYSTCNIRYLVVVVIFVVIIIASPSITATVIIVPPRLAVITALSTAV